MELDKETMITYLINKFKKEKIERKKKEKISLVEKDDKTIIPLYFITNYLSINKYFSTLSVFLEEARINIKEIQNEYIQKLKKVDFSLGYFFEIKTTDFFMKKNAFSILEDFFKKEDKIKFENKFIQTNLIEINNEEIDLKLRRIEDKYKNNISDDNFIRKETISSLNKNKKDMNNFHKLNLRFLKDKLALKISLDQKLNNHKKI